MEQLRLINDNDRKSTTLNNGQLRASPGMYRIQIPKGDVVFRWDDDESFENGSWVRLPFELYESIYVTLQLSGLDIENMTFIDMLNELRQSYVS